MKCAGSMLLEVIVYCALAGALASLIFAHGVRIVSSLRSLAAESERLASIYTVLAALRSDLQHAHNIRVTGDRAFMFNTAQQTVAWLLDDEHRLERRSMRSDHGSATSVVLDDLASWHIQYEKVNEHMHAIIIKLTHNDKNYEIYQSFIQD